MRALVICLLPGRLRSRQPGVFLADLLSDHAASLDHPPARATDPDRREGRGLFFFGLAVVVCGLVAGAYLLSGTLLCLALIDTVWNAWHFGSQHAGVLRIYSRKAGVGWASLEKHGTRCFVTYVALRVPGWATGYLRAEPTLNYVVSLVDLVILAIPAVLLMVQLCSLSGKSWANLPIPKLCALCGLVVRGSSGRRPLVIAFTLASALIPCDRIPRDHHALRLAAANRRSGAFASWPHAGAWYSVRWRTGPVRSSLGTAAGDLRIGMNLAASYLHYAYDGLIWKLRGHCSCWGPHEFDATMGGRRGPHPSPWAPLAGRPSVIAPFVYPGVAVFHLVAALPLGLILAGFLPSSRVWVAAGLVGVGLTVSTGEAIATLLDASDANFPGRALIRTSWSIGLLLPWLATLKVTAASGLRGVALAAVIALSWATIPAFLR